MWPSTCSLKVTRDSKDLDSASIRFFDEGWGEETGCAEAFEIAVTYFCVAEKETNYILEKDGLEQQTKNQEVQGLRLKHCEG